MAVAIAVAATLAVVWLALNLTLGNKQIDTRLTPLYPVAGAQFPRAMGSILGPALEPGNEVHELLNGAQSFPAMLDAIRSARESITFETYVFWSGSIGHEFAEALSERARAGVKVHVLLDWLGGYLDDALLERMQRAGVELRRYNSPHWYSLHRLNNRTHRKLLVVDGRTGFTGGRGNARHGLAAAARCGRLAACPGVHQLARRRRREHAAHVSAVDRRGGRVDPAFGVLLRSGQRGRQRAGGGARARRGASCWPPSSPMPAVSRTSPALCRNFYAAGCDARCLRYGISAA